jgi:hypothetical protein
LPADGGVDADPECSGQDCCGDFGGELEQCCAAGLVGSDAEPVQSQLESFGADRAAGLASGEQPMRRGGRADGGVASAAGDDAADQFVDRVGQPDRCAAEADADTVIGTVTSTLQSLRAGCREAWPGQIPELMIMGLAAAR